MPNRRDFLKLAAASVTATVSTSPLRAAGPFSTERPGGARLRLSLAAYSFRNYFHFYKGQPNRDVIADRAMNMFDFVDYCADHDLTGAELTSYFFADTSADYLTRLRRHCFLRGVSVSGTAIGNNFSHPPGERRQQEIATTKMWIDRAALLGAPHVRVFAGETDEITREAADKLVVSALEECCDYAGQRGIFLGIENHDSIGSAAKLIPIVEAVRSPWLGINLDSGNFRTETPLEDFAACLPYAVNIQLKTEIGLGSSAGEHAADLSRLVTLMRDAGYQGWIALEYEAAEDPLAAVPHYLRELQALLG